MKTARRILITLVIVLCVWVVQMFAFPRVNGPLVWERLRAVERTNDQTVLARVASRDNKPSVRHSAVKQLTDQTTLARVAVNDLPEIRYAAVVRLTDQSTLAQIAVSDPVDWICLAAVERLTDEGLELSARTADPQDSAYLRAAAEFVHAANEIPAEHRIRILADLLPVARVYSRPGWTSLFGSLDSITIQWEQVFEAYIPYHVVHGERIDYAATFTATDQELTASWRTVFPDSISNFPSGRFREWLDVRIKPSEAYLPWIATQSIVISLTDQSLLAEIAADADDAKIRRAAVERLSDDAALARVATDAPWFPEVRRMAVQKLRDQSILASIAATDSSEDVRAAAVQRLSELAQ